MKPRDVTNAKVHDKLRRDNKSVAAGWIVVDGARGTVTVCKQRAGEPPDGMTVLPIKAFNTLIDWYNADQKPPRNSSRG